MSAHMVELPKAVWILKIVQVVLAVLILALSAFEVYCAAFSAHAFAIFTALWTILVLVYYFVAIHGAQHMYNWVALLVLECLTVIFWLVTWAILAALYTALVWANSYAYYTYKRDTHSLSKRDTNLGVAYGALFITTIVFSVIQFVLYCVTLGFIGACVHRHRKANKPMKAVYGGSGAASQYPEKINMQPMSA